MKLKMATVVAVACSACAMSAVADADACSDAAVDARIEKLRKADAEIPGFKPGSAVKVE